MLRNFFLLLLTGCCTIVMGQQSKNWGGFSQPRGDRQQPVAKVDLSPYQYKMLVDGSDTLPYRILLPANYDSTVSYPMILFLHGAGERGFDNESQLVHGAALFLNPQNRSKFPAIVAFPQCPKSSFWSNVKITVDSSTGKRIFDFPVDGDPTIAMQMAIKLVKALQTEYKVKSDQVYVMGLSMGGMGTFEILRRMPSTFAAAIPICGGANPATAKKIMHVPMWIIHGAKDDVVPPELSENMLKAMVKWKESAEMQYTIYPDANHNSWDPAFAEPTLLPWLFSQRKGQ